MISERGLAYITDKNMEQFALKMMKVERVVLPESDWVAFLGYHRSDAGDSGEDEGYENKTQYCHLFSQSDLSQCLHTFKAEKGCKITEIVALGLDTFAVARDDGSVTVKVLRKNKSMSGTFDGIYDQQILMSETFSSKQHSYDKIDNIIYCGETAAEYCATSGTTLYNGSSDLTLTLNSKITHLRTFKDKDGQAIIAAG